MKLLCRYEHHHIATSRIHDYQHPRSILRTFCEYSDNLKRICTEIFNNYSLQLSGTTYLKIVFNSNSF